MEKQDVIEFFDRLAPTWDDDMVKNDAVIEKILDTAKINEGSEVLDVACGTGVLFPYYLYRLVNHIMGVDISSRMIARAAGKYSDDDRIRLICSDVEDLKGTTRYDAAVVYNALPHFLDPKSLITSLAGQLKKGGTLTIAHGMSQEKVNAHHFGLARPVSQTLIPAEELAVLFEKEFDQIVIVSDSTMYLVSGRKK